MNSTVFVDDISITFLYVSSSDLVLKNDKYKELSFLHDTKISQTRMQNVRFSYMPPTCESMKMTHTKN